MSTWHYLPVYVENDGERTYSLCEVYLDGDERLIAWSSQRDIAPHGCDNTDELLADLARMIGDVQRWQPVEFDALTVGMRFEPRISTPDSEALPEGVRTKSATTLSNAEFRARRIEVQCLGRRAIISRTSTET